MIVLINIIYILDIDTLAPIKQILQSKPSFISFKIGLGSPPTFFKTGTKVWFRRSEVPYVPGKKEYYGFNNDFFVVSDAKPIADSNIYAKRTKLAELANLKPIRIHDFRHSCASLLINNGANVTLVAKYLGHTKIEETLNTYSHMFSTALDSVVSVIDSLEDD